MHLLIAVPWRLSKRTPTLMLCHASSNDGLLPVRSDSRLAIGSGEGWRSIGALGAEGSLAGVDLGVRVTCGAFLNLAPVSGGGMLCGTEPDLGVLCCREPWTAVSGRNTSGMLACGLGLDPGSALNALLIGWCALLDAGAVSSVVGTSCFTGGGLWCTVGAGGSASCFMVGACMGGVVAGVSAGTCCLVTTIRPRVELG